MEQITSEFERSIEHSLTPCKSALDACDEPPNALTEAVMTCLLSEDAPCAPRRGELNKHSTSSGGVRHRAHYMFPAEDGGSCETHIFAEEFVGEERYLTHYQCDGVYLFVDCEWQTPPGCSERDTVQIEVYSDGH